MSGSVAGNDPPQAILSTWNDAADGDGNFNGIFDDGEGFELTEGTWTKIQQVMSHLFEIL